MGRMDPLVNALNAAITTTTSDVYIWSHMILGVICCFLILLIHDHLLPGRLGAWEETTPALVRYTEVLATSFLAIGISLVLHITGYLILYGIKYLVKAIWTQIEIMAIALYSGMSKRYAISADIGREVLPTKPMPLVILAVLQAWQWLSSVLRGFSAVHTALATVSWSACKNRSASSSNALHGMALTAPVLGLFHVGRAVDVAYAISRVVCSLPANSAQKAKSWLARCRAAPITWDVSETEINIPTTDRRARLDSRALGQTYDMLLKSSDVFRQLTKQQKVDAIKHITKDIVNFQKGVGHVYAPRKAFSIAAQMIDLQCSSNRDHFKLFARLKVGRVASEAKEQDTRVFAVFIYLVFMLTCGIPKMEQPRAMLDQAGGDVQLGASEKETKDPNAKEQCAKLISEASAHREVVSSDSGYGGSP